MENTDNINSKNFIITYHCDGSYDWRAALTAAYGSGHYQCASGQLEAGKKDGKIHLQAFVLAEKKSRGKKILKDFPSGAWFKAANKFNKDPANTAFRMYSYSIKEATRVDGPLVLGEPPKQVNNSDNGKRGRTKQMDRYASALELAERGDFDTLKEEHPDFYTKHYTTYKRVHNEHKKTDATPFSHPIRPWQQKCLELLEQPNDRSIFWFYDQPGNSGKSTWLKHLAQSPSSFYIDGGKKTDNLFLIGEQHTLLLVDLPRYSREYVPYSTMETYKNGIWTVTKYEGSRVHRKLPGSVVVVANFLPDINKLSHDRWEIYEILPDFTVDYIPILDLINNPVRYQYLEIKN